MNIPELIKEAHENAVERGFYDCPKCGDGYMSKIDICPVCKNEGIDPNKNIGELLMLIVSELGEALEAHRCGLFADWDVYGSDCEIELNEYTEESQHKYIEEIKIKNFELYIKDTFEDEIADVFLRLFDLCGYKEWELKDNTQFSDRNWQGNIGESLAMISHSVLHIAVDAFNINIVYNSLWHFCSFHQIPIEKHISAKMAYNKTRPHKHGKEY